MVTRKDAILCGDVSNLIKYSVLIVSILNRSSYAILSLIRVYIYI